MSRTPFAALSALRQARAESPVSSLRTRMIKKPILVLLCAVSWAVSAQDAISAKDITGLENGLVPRILVEGEKAQTYNLRERMQRFNTPGLSAAVFKDGKVIWAQGYGYADAERRVPVDVHTRFQSASISKSVTAFAVLKLVQTRHLDLDRNVNDYLVGWKVPDNAFTQTEKVTIRRLLSHTAGLNVEGFPGYEKTAKIPDAVGVLDGAGNSPKLEVVATPGSKYAYSGGGYVVLQKLVEDLSGKPFVRYMQDELLTPLKMSESSYDPYPTKSMSLAYDFGGKVYPGGWHVYPELAPAGLWTTPSDLAKFCFAVRDASNGAPSAYLSQPLAKEMLTPSGKPDGGDAYSLGFEFRGQGENASIGHGGSHAGFKSELFYFSRRDLGVVLMTNSDSGRIVRNELARSISNLYHLDLFPAKTVKRLPLSRAQLDAYAGRYQFEKEKDYYFSAALESNGDLILKDLVDGKTNTFVAVAPDKFVDRYSGEEAEFKRDKPGGAITGLLYDGDETLRRVAR
jgi:CubicO group peptidase (beta-lactamase class C family)